jgi:hypothetical protein
MFNTDYNQSADLPVFLFTSAGVAITGALHTAVTVYYKKQGATSWTTKVMSASNWTESSGGLYYITFTPTELNTYGNFWFRTVHASGYYVGGVTITDYATEATSLANIYTLISTKVNKDDILDRERALDTQVSYLQKLYNEMLTDIQEINNQLAGLRRRIGS